MISWIFDKKVESINNRFSHHLYLNFRGVIRAFKRTICTCPTLQYLEFCEWVLVGARAIASALRHGLHTLVQINNPRMQERYPTFNVYSWEIQFQKFNHYIQYFTTFLYQ